MYQDLKVAVILPAYQEERLIATTLQSLPQWLDGVIVVDDASSDQTVSQVLACQTTLPFPLTLIQNQVNQGVGKSIIEGYRRAETLGFDVGVVMGADAQMDPMEMPRLLNLIVQGAIYAKGERFSHPHVRQKMPALRYWGNRILSAWTRWISGDHHLQDAQCGYTALQLSVLNTLPLDQIYPRYGFPNDFFLRLTERQYPIAHCPITPIYGLETSTLSIPKVIFPISWILLKGLIRKWTQKRKFLKPETPIAHLQK